MSAPLNSGSSGGGPQVPAPVALEGRRVRGQALVAHVAADAAGALGAIAASTPGPFAPQMSNQKITGNSAVRRMSVTWPAALRYCGASVHSVESMRYDAPAANSR